MGLLESSSRRCVLGADQLIGREPSASIRLEDESVSWRHASLRWTGLAWELQDLGSLNGTFVDGQRIAPGGRALLKLGSEIRFGQSQESWQLEEDEPPATSLVDILTGERITGLDDLIAAPKSGEPGLFLSRQANGEWLAECEDRVWEPQPMDVIAIAGRQYRFEPGIFVYATSAGKSQQLTPQSLGLDFAVSRDEEHVAITIVHGERRVELRPRAHSYMVLTLARLRLQDQANDTLSKASHGWVHQERLVRMLATTPPLLAVDIYRARRQFSEAGVSDAAQVIERRSTTHELRIGVSKISIQVG
jgi:FHA domain